jgi:signal transduction histidine kinase
MRTRPLVRRLSSLGRLFVALVVLVGVWLVALRGVDAATKQAEARRLDDRRELALGYANLLRPWLDAARGEAVALAASLGAAPKAEAIGSIIETHERSAGSTFGRVLVVGPRMAGERKPGHTRIPIVATSSSPVPPSTELQECAGDGRLADLVENTRAGQRPVRIVTVPWDCATPVVASAEPAGPNVVVVMAALGEGRSLVGPAAVGLLRIEVLDPAFDEGVDSSDRTAFVQRVRAKPVTLERYGGLVGAYADAGSGWGVVVEQLASSFDGDGLPGQPVVVGATVLAAALVIVFVLLVFFDYRRRKVYARTEDAKHAFFATVGHELRTPLTILKGYSDTLTARWDSLSDESKEMLVSNMAPAAQRLAGLVEKLILASNIQAEAYIKPVVRPTNVSEVLQQVAARWRPLAPLHTFVVDVDPLMPEALADADALEQVLQQLLDNAVKYSPSGGRVTLSAMRDKRGVGISVSDEGVGLPQNAREIFEPLVQGEAVDTRVHDEGGAGVGLFIVRTLVRDMGGSVRAEAQQPAGSRFVVTLRAAKAKAAARPVTRV